MLIQRLVIATHATFNPEPFNHQLINSDSGALCTSVCLITFGVLVQQSEKQMNRGVLWVPFDVWTCAEYLNAVKHLYDIICVLPCSDSNVTWWLWVQKALSEDASEECFCLHWRFKPVFSILKNTSLLTHPKNQYTGEICFDFSDATLTLWFITHEKRHQERNVSHHVLKLWAGSQCATKMTRHGAEMRYKIRLPCGLVFKPFVKKCQYDMWKREDLK